MRTLDTLAVLPSDEDCTEDESAEIKHYLRTWGEHDPLGQLLAHRWPLERDELMAEHREDCASMWNAHDLCTCDKGDRP